MAFQPYDHKKELSKPERFVGGHRLCAGCGAGIVCRGITRALDEGDRAVICNATGCLEVSSFLYPYTSWTDSYIHSAFENAAATCGGVEAAYRVLKKRERSMTPSSSWPSAGTGAPMTSGSSPCPAPWSGGTTWSTSAMTTRRT